MRLVKMKMNYPDEARNIISSKVKALRQEKGGTQKELAAKLQLEGLQFTDLTVLRIEKGERLVTDFELKIIAKVFEVTYRHLLDN